MEAALAELELATLLIRAGFEVNFLPESQSRSADLQCCRRGERLYLEVTAVIGSERSPRHTHLFRRSPLEDQLENDEDIGDAPLLVRRLLGRIGQKGVQLEGYREPVVLAITVPPQDRLVVGLDLKRLAGMVTMSLAAMRQISGVLLSLWDVEPAPTQAALRLRHVLTVERPRGQRVYPRVRMLITNPYATCPLSPGMVEGLQGML